MSAATSPGTGLAYGVERVCAAWGFARSSFYAMKSRREATADRRPAKRRGPKPTLSDADLLAAIRTDLAASPWQGEGHRKVWARLRVRDGIRVSRKRVLRIMRENTLLSPHRCRRRDARAHDGEIVTNAPTAFIAPELGPLVGERVHVRLDPADAGRVWVFDTAGAFVCVAEAPERTGIDRAEVAAKMKALARAADTEARAYARDLKRRVKPETAIDEILAEAQRSRGEENIVGFPPATAPHTAPGLDAAADASSGITPPDELTAEQRVILTRLRDDQVWGEYHAKRRDAGVYERLSAAEEERLDKFRRAWGW